MARPATARNARRTVSRLTLERLADVARRQGFGAAVVFPDGTRLVLTPPGDEVQPDGPDPFAGFK